MKTLREFYESISEDKEISIYNSKNELILNWFNICDCDEIVEEYGDTTNYSYDELDNRIDIILHDV